jgi:ubiquinol-cytochrome c reductase iron-sulfur subunit
VLLGSASAAGISLVAALLLPARSLGPSPGRSLFRTPWKAGRRLATPDGAVLRPEDLELGNIVTVFPEGAVDADDAATLLIRVEADLLQLPPDRLAGAPGGLVAYSKICTHVGCPVGLYRETTHELVCPCHQSTFDVLHGAQPTFGPATRALPQLPIGVDEEGYLIALGDYPEPVGPGFWNRGT